MITEQELSDLIRAGLPDAEVRVTDRTGQRDHYIIQVKSAAFNGLNLMDRHRRVMGLLQPAMMDGRLHAAEIKTEPA